MLKIKPKKKILCVIVINQIKNKPLKIKNLIYNFEIK